MSCRFRLPGAIRSAGVAHHRGNLPPVGEAGLVR